MEPETLMLPGGDGAIQFFFLRKDPWGWGWDNWHCHDTIAFPPENLMWAGGGCMLCYDMLCYAMICYATEWNVNSQRGRAGGPGGFFSRKTSFLEIEKLKPG